MRAKLSGCSLMVAVCGSCRLPIQGQLPQLCLPQFVLGSLVTDGDGRWRVGDPAATDALDWRDGIFAALKAAAIRQVGYVPDAGHARLIELCRGDPAIRAVALTSEEEGVALAAGAWLGGQRAALL